MKFECVALLLHDSGFENMRGNEIILNGLKYEFSTIFLALMNFILPISFDENSTCILLNRLKILHSFKKKKKRSLYEKPAIIYIKFFLKAEGGSL